MTAVFLKELYSYVRTGTAYIFLGFFLLLSGIFFTISNLWGAGSSDLRLTLANITLICLVTVPLLTMRLLAEERRNRTDQLLLTTPVGVPGVVVGKYLAACSIYLIGLIGTLAYPVLLSRVGLVALSEVVGSYLGVLLLGSSLIAIGLYVSSLTENQFVSALATFGVILSVVSIDWLYRSLPADRTSGVVFSAALVLGLGMFLFRATRSVPICLAACAAGGGAVFVLGILSPESFEGLLIRSLRWISLIDRVKSFNNGVLELSSVVYYLTFSFVFVFLTVQVLERRRWR